MVYFFDMRPEILWHTLPIKDIETELETTPDGLSHSQVELRQKKYGKNTLAVKRNISYITIFGRQFLSPLVYFLVFAAGVSIFLGELSDSYIILAAVAITVGFGFFQESKAERTMYALKELLTGRATVIRDGRKTTVDSEELVSGDVLVIGEGDKISADARLIEAVNLKIEEAPLTGESMPVEKHTEELDRGMAVSDRKNIVYRGTTAVHGRGVAIVVSTGKFTEIGKIATSIELLGEGETPLQKDINRVAFLITVVVGVMLVLLFFVGLIRQLPLADLLTTSIAVAVAAIPESLVVVVTVILAVGMVRLLNARTLVRKLVSAETLGGTTVICVDKTGTLTEGKMSVEEVVTFGGVESDEAIKYALLVGMVTNEAYFDDSENAFKKEVSSKGDPTECAILNAGKEKGLMDQYVEKESHIIDELPFESVNQYMATLVQEKGKYNKIYIKGSPEKLIESSLSVWGWSSKQKRGTTKKISEKKRKELIAVTETLSSQGYRLMAVGYRDVGKTITTDHTEMPLETISQLGENILQEVVLVGLLAIADPVRPDVADTITRAQNAGVRVVMITGDHKLTALTIAKEIGLPSASHNVLLGTELEHMSDEELADVVPHISIYARIVPHDKLRIVKVLEESGEVTAMTGDGINDAPALKQASVGVAMGGGTDVAKEAADIVILDDNFSTIVKAVKEGRIILDNIRKVSLYLLKDSFSEVILLGSAIIIGLPLPILAAQVLWINIVQDGFPAFALAYEPAEKRVMDLKPEGRGRKLITREMKIIIFAVGIITDFLLLGVFIWLYTQTQLDITYIRTVVFAGLALTSLLVIFSLKSLREPIYKINLFNNFYLLASVGVGICLLLVAIYIPFFNGLLHLVPISMSHWLLVICLSIIQIILIEIVKYFFVQREKIDKDAEMHTT